LTDLFISRATARTEASEVGIHCNIAAYNFHRLRQLIGAIVEDGMPFFGEVKVDDSDVGGRCKGKPVRGAAGNVAVFGILVRDRGGYTMVISETRLTTLLQILKS
jgi:transposase-like protein